MHNEFFSCSKERERLFAKYGVFGKIDEDHVFIKKNLELYNDEQARRTAAKSKPPDRSHLTRGDFTGIELIDSNQTAPTKKTEPNSDDNNVETTPGRLTPESQRIFEDMFSS